MLEDQGQFTELLLLCLPLILYFDIIVRLSGVGLVHRLGFDIVIPLSSTAVPTNECIPFIHDLKRGVFFLARTSPTSDRGSGEVTSSLNGHVI